MKAVAMRIVPPTLDRLPAYAAALREECQRAYDGRPLRYKQSWETFEWRETDSVAACQFLVPRKEKK